MLSIASRSCSGDARRIDVAEKTAQQARRPRVWGRHWRLRGGTSSAGRVDRGACQGRGSRLERAPWPERGRSSGVEHNLAKVGVEGSNPFARSRFSQENQEVERGPSRPFLLTWGAAVYRVSMG